MSNIRRGRLNNEKLAYALDNLKVLRVSTEAAPAGDSIETAIRSAMQAGLTYYDELYVRLAEFKNIPLFTFDKQMRNTARRRGVAVLPS